MDWDGGLFSEQYADDNLLPGEDQEEYIVEHECADHWKGYQYQQEEEKKEEGLKKKTEKSSIQDKRYDPLKKNKEDAHQILNARISLTETNEIVSNKFGVLKVFKPKQRGENRISGIDDLAQYSFYEKFMTLDFSKGVKEELWDQLRKASLELYVQGMIRDKKSKKIITKEQVKTEEMKLLQMISENPRQKLELPIFSMKLTLSHYVIYNACHEKNLPVIRLEIVSVLERRQSNIDSQKIIRDRGHKFVPTLTPKKRGRPIKQ